MSVGIEYNPKSASVSPLANLRLIHEGPRRPAVMLGTSSDRIGTPTGQGFYVTVSKDLEREIGLPIAPYLGAAFGTYDNELRAIGGINVRLAPGLSSLVIFDGVHVHPTVTYSWDRFGASLVLVRARDPGVSLNVRF